MLPGKVRWAILGAGKIAHKFAQDIKSVNNARLAAVASSDEGRALSFAKQYNIEQTYNYSQLYESKEVDAVYIATPHNFHFEQCLLCLQNGKAVLCEKPITINDSQFKKLAAVAKEKNLFLMEAMWTYFLPAIQKAKEWLQQDRIGQLKVIQADFGFAMPYNPDGRLYNKALAGGALLDLGIYPIAFSNYFMGTAPQTIAATATLGHTGVDENTSIVLQYQNVFAHLFTSMVCKTASKGLLFGERGYIEVPFFWKATGAKLYNAEHELVDTFEDKRTTWGYDFEIAHASASILAGSKESNIVPHVTSNTLQDIMTTVRKQIGLQYPEETF